MADNTSTTRQRELADIVVWYGITYEDYEGGWFLKFWQDTMHLIEELGRDTENAAPAPRAPPSPIAAPAQNNPYAGYFARASASAKQADEVESPKKRKATGMFGTDYIPTADAGKFAFGTVPDAQGTPTKSTGPPLTPKSNLRYGKLASDTPSGASGLPKPFGSMGLASGSRLFAPASTSSSQARPQPSPSRSTQKAPAKDDKQKGREEGSSSGTWANPFARYQGL